MHEHAASGFMISRIHIQDFKAHKSTTVDLGPLTVLVGDNASGKTSVLDALWLQAAINPNPVQALRGNFAPEDLLRRGANGPMVLTSKGVTGEPWKTKITVELQPKTGAGQERPWELLLETSGKKIVKATGQGSGGNPGHAQDWAGLAATVGNVGLYRLRADRIASAAYSDQPEISIGSDGTNTAVALAAMKLGNDEVFERIEKALRALIPAVERIRIRPANVSHPTVGTVVGSKLYFDFRGAPGVPAHSASHGTLIVLALLALIHGNPRPNMILLDDFDHALHPRAQMELVRMLKELLALDEFRGLQIVATTHSPYTLDELEPADVQAFALREDGTVASKRLSAHPDAKKTQGSLRAGQLWTLDPEKDWVLGDKAA
jgi:predicted ATPase